VPRSDAELIDACSKGDELAWRQLVDRYQHLVYAIPRRYGLGTEDREEVFQSVFLRLFQNLEELRDRERLVGWLITTAHRESWKLGKAASALSADDGIVDLESPPSHLAEQWELAHRVRSALAELDLRCQKLLESLFLQHGGCTYEEAAQKLGIPLGSVGPTRKRCFRKLKEICEERGLWPPP